MSEDASSVKTPACFEGVLDDFGVKGEIVNVRPGPGRDLVRTGAAPGVKSSRVIGLADDIARSMSAIRLCVAVVQGRNAIGVELPNHDRETVYLRELLGATDFETSATASPSRSARPSSAANPSSSISPACPTRVRGW